LLLQLLCELLLAATKALDVGGECGAYRVQSLHEHLLLLGQLLLFHVDTQLLFTHIAAVGAQFFVSGSVGGLWTLYGKTAQHLAQRSFPRIGVGPPREARPRHSVIGIYGLERLHTGCP